MKKIVIVAGILFSIVIAGNFIQQRPSNDIEPTQEPLIIAIQTEKPIVTPKATIQAKATTKPTIAPTAEPTETPTEAPTKAPTDKPTIKRTVKPNPTKEPTAEPTIIPTVEPTNKPTTEPTPKPTISPTVAPTAKPTIKPTPTPRPQPTATLTAEPTQAPTVAPTIKPTPEPTPEVIKEWRWVATFKDESMTFTEPHIQYDLPTFKITAPIVSGEKNWRIRWQTFETDVLNPNMLAKVYCTTNNTFFFLTIAQSRSGTLYLSNGKGNYYIHIKVNPKYILTVEEYR